MSGPHVTIDPELPIGDPIAVADAINRAFDEGYAARADEQRLDVWIGAAAGAIVGFGLAVLLLVVPPTVAAPRAAQPATGDATGPARAEQPGAPRDGMPVEVLEADASGEAPALAGGVGAPQPTGEISAIQAGTATWCAPTPTHCQSWGGDAHLGAMQSFGFGDRPYQVTVRFDDRSTTVTVVSFCACPNTLIDLSPAAFNDLAPTGVDPDAWRRRIGRINVTVEDAAAGVTSPPTDVEP